MGLDANMGDKQLDGHFLLFENYFGDGELVSAQEIFKII